MRILSLDSTAQTASCAVCENGKLIAEYTLNCKNTHSETLLPMISVLLRHIGITAKDIDLFACSAGPGSFTGVRIGAATVKGLAFGTDKCCIGVSTLASLAYNLKGFNGIICPVMNARRNQVYNALFDGNGNRITPDRAISIEDLEKEIKEKYGNTTVYLCGDGTEVTLNGLSKNTENVISAPERLLYQSAYSVAMCALEMFNNGVRTKDVELTPVYLRLSQAERERLAKESGSLENIEKEGKI